MGIVINIILMLIMITVAFIIIKSVNSNYYGGYYEIESKFAFPYKNFKEVLSSKINDSIAVTIYELPEKIDTTWWVDQLELMYKLEEYKVLNAHCKEPKSNCGLWSSYGWGLIHEYGKKYDPIDSLGFMPPLSTKSFDLSSKVKNIGETIFSDPQKMSSMQNALIECINEYSGQSGETVPKYLVTAHPVGHPDFVYINMRVKTNFKNNKGSVEHRHITTPLFALSANILDSKYPKYPGKLSMIFHKKTAEMILKLHPDSSTIEVNPMTSMAKIIEKENFGKFKFEENTGAYNWIYDYKNLAEGKNLDQINTREKWKVIYPKFKPNEINNLINSNFIVDDFKGSTLEESNKSIKTIGVQFSNSQYKHIQLIGK